MTVILGPKTKIDELLREYPFLEDFLLARSAKFRLLKNPLMRSTVGRLTTLDQMAAIASIDVRDLLQELAAEIVREGVKDLTIEYKASEDAPRPFSDPGLRQEILRDIARDLKDGLDVEILQKRFSDLVRDVNAAEIARMEHELIEEGLPEGEVKPLCNRHADIFRLSPSEQETPAAGRHVESPGFTSESGASSAIPLDAGYLTPEELNLILTNLPADLTFVNERDEVVYYSQTKTLLFPRSPDIIGGSVQDCHPRKSLDMVQKILDEFRAGKKDVAEFWIQIRGRFIHIRYFAIHDAAGIYRGTLEMSQDVTDIRSLEGEKRYLEWDH
jgi:DUF438 domain-containing protein